MAYRLIKLKYNNLYRHGSQKHEIVKLSAESCHFNLAVFRRKSWPHCVAISRDIIARQGSNSYIWFTNHEEDAGPVDPKNKYNVLPLTLYA